MPSCAKRSCQRQTAVLDTPASRMIAWVEARVAAYVEHYNYARAHESLGNLTPADVCFGRGEAILQERARIKRQTLKDLRLRHHAQAA